MSDEKLVTERPTARTIIQSQAGQPTAPVTDPDHAKHLESAGVGLSKWGSVDRWPCLSLLPTQFPICVCGKPRSHHQYSGTDLLGLKNAARSRKLCQTFRAPGKWTAAPANSYQTPRK